MKSIIIESQAILKTTELFLNGEKYDITFSLNVINAIQKEFGGLDEIFDKIDNTEVEAIIRILEILINDCIDRERIFEKKERPYIDVNALKYLIGASNLNYYAQTIMGALGVSLPEAEQQEEVNEDGNTVVVTDEMREMFGEAEELPTKAE